MTDITEINERSPFLRGLGFYNPSDHPDDHVTFVGAGGIGSFAAFGAAKLGIPSVTVIDHDEVDIHNYGNQLYTEADVGDPKVTALEGLTTGNMIDGRHCQFEDAPAGEFRNVVVSGLDSMEARANLWRDRISLNPRVKLYLDARLGGQVIVIYAVNPLNMDSADRYEATLYSDEEAEDAPCTERGVIDVGLMVGSLLTRYLRLHFTGHEIPAVTYVNQSTLYVEVSHD